MIKSEAEFEFGDRVYKIGLLDVFEQFHVSRRLTPVLAAGGLAMFKALSEQQKAGQGLGPTDWLLMMAPMAEVLAKMPQEDADYVLHTCLKVVRVKAADKWSVLLTGGGALLIADLGLPATLRLVVEVLQHNLGDFFPQNLKEGSS